MSSSNDLAQNNTNNNNNYNRKRPSTEPPSHAPPTLKKRKPSQPTSVELYRELLNSYITSLSPSSQSHFNEEGLLRGRTTQIGLTLWTPQEKQKFFHSLSVLGKDNIESIALRIGPSKSPLETKSYIQHLEKGLEEHCFHAGDYRLLSSPLDQPAALEISSECCKALEREADFLNDLLERDDWTKDGKKWGHYVVLDEGIARDVELAISEEEGGDDGVRRVKEVVPAAELLRLQTWLELSKGVFMNPGYPREEENWRNVGMEDGDSRDEEDGPKIHFTAFQDFANLTVGVTERLVQAALLSAESRCKVIGDDEKDVDLPMVRMEDVHAGCKLLKIPHTSREVWIGAPRRAGVGVYRLIKEWEGHVEDAKIMRYEDVEDELSGRRIWKEVMNGKSKSGVKDEGKHSASSSKKRREDDDREGDSSSYEEDDSGSDYSNSSKSSTSSSTKNERRAEEEEAQSHEDGYETEDEEEEQEKTDDLYSTDSETNYTKNGRYRRKVHNRLEILRAQDRYMELIDQKASGIEEKRLWKDVLCRTPPPPVEETMIDKDGMVDKDRVVGGETMELPNKPHRIRPNAADLVDWRDGMEYWSDWETLKKMVSKEAFEYGSGLERKDERERVGDMTRRVGMGSNEMRVLRSRTRNKNKEVERTGTLHAYWKPARRSTSGGSTSKHVDDGIGSEDDDGHDHNDNNDDHNDSNDNQDDDDENDNDDDDDDNNKRMSD
ncbi:MAG: Electron transfer flavoprotein alpha-subunit [Watsoniomyces obsoletus]|nr:MAG: Electron transfer flavoprotein alpha-subunit [Watsoniomyces obsoletus]